MEHPPLTRRASLAADGFSDFELRRGVRSGELVRLRRGSYLVSPIPADAAERHRLAIRAAAPDLAESAVVSHASAAVLHDLPPWGLPLARVHITRSRTYGGRRTPRLHARVARLEDGRSESVGESRSRVLLARFGLPPPQPQWELRDAHGVIIGHVDFGWPERKVVGEFDGRFKYSRLLEDGESAGDAVYREKLREDALRAAGCTVIRWTWADLDDFAATAHRLRAALTGS